MRLLRLHLKAFGPFTDRVLDFGAAVQGLVFVYGPNEAGKSSALRAISDLRFGIPQQSKDNFLHAHAEMRVGGEFIDVVGKKYSLIRRKGRGATLLFADFDSGGSTLEVPMPPEVESLLTCGLRRDEYDSMFGLDHHRLREGGEALLKGEGDVGAALFEASAGVRSIPQILERMDASARTFFMPGARGKNARINEALKAYDDRHSEFRQVQVRPAHWADLFKKQQAAASEVTELEARGIALTGRLLLIKELRAVAPLLSAFDHASTALEGLKAVTLLPATAAAERAAAESALSDAQYNASSAEADAKIELQRLGELKFDTAILNIAPAVKRLAASAEAIDRERKNLAGATADVVTETERVGELASRMAESHGTEKVLDRAPTKAERTRIEHLLRDVDLAQQALNQHQESQPQDADIAESTVEELPSSESRTALRAAEAEVVRSDGLLRRLAALPGEIKATRRAVTIALEAIELADEAELRRVRPLLDAQIDAAMNQEQGDTTRREGLETRITEISKALPAAIKHRDLLLEQGVVATRDEVQEARSLREAGWKLIRGTYIDRTSPPTDGFTGGKSLPLAYEDAVSNADTLVDGLAGDTERAAQLQSSKRDIETLETDRAELLQKIEEIGREAEPRRAVWSQTLSRAHMPDLSPAALRDWQALLPAARSACESLQAKLDEQEHAQATLQALAMRLREAILRTGLANPAADATLSTLSAAGSQVDEAIKEREKTISKVAGTRLERERQLKQRAAREINLKSAFELATAALQPTLAGLLLPLDATVSVARVRVGEFEDLLDAKDRLMAAKAKERSAREALAVLLDSAKAIWGTLGEPEPADIRIYIEQISARLEIAERVQTTRTMAQQALDAAKESQRKHGETAARHQQTLSALCLAGSVESVSLLPEAEEQSQRKREAIAEVDRASTQLALSSRRPVDELRTLLTNHDAARMDVDEATCLHEQTQVQDRLQASRPREESARRALEAIDGADTAAAAREGMERAAAGVRANMSPWIRSRIAYALLAEALKRFRERAQGPMLTAASSYFGRMTRGEFIRLVSDESGKEPVLIAQRRNDLRIRVEEMSEGTRDQLYLALRLAALDMRRAAGVDLPVVLDDVLITSDDDRSGVMLEALADFARTNQVIVFSHHKHIVDVARKHVPAERLEVVSL